MPGTKYNISFGQRGYKATKPQHMQTSTPRFSQPLLDAFGKTKQNLSYDISRCLAFQKTEVLVLVLANADGQA